MLLDLLVVDHKSAITSLLEDLVPRTLSYHSRRLHRSLLAQPLILSNLLPQSRLLLLTVLSKLRRGGVSLQRVVPIIDAHLAPIHDVAGGHLRQKVLHMRSRLLMILSILMA